MTRLGRLRLSRSRLLLEKAKVEFQICKVLETIRREGMTETLLQDPGRFF